MAPPAAIHTSRSPGRERPACSDAPQARQKLPEAGAPHDGHFSSTGIEVIGRDYQVKEAPFPRGWEMKAGRLTANKTLIVNRR
jgi:hypothetical protein